MKTWRGLGLVLAVLSLGVMACDGGGGSEKADASDPDDESLDSGTSSIVPEDEEDGDTSEPEQDGEADAGPAMTLDSCQPKSCSDFGYECGTASDGCGGQLDCGKCKGADTCGGGGQPNMCGCTIKTCEQLSSERGVKVCGTFPGANGCGRDLVCGDDCGANSTCGGGGIPNECGCTPKSDPCAGKECGTADDGCGQTVQCGANAGMCSANRECSSQQTCQCKADTTAFCADKCGTQQTPDGCTATCPACSQTCDPNPGAACTNCNCSSGQICYSSMCCVPDAQTATCAVGQCGVKLNNCGQQVDCGGCQNGQVCYSGQCKDPAAELIGKYAARSVGFGVAASVVSRGEGLLLVDIYRENGKLMMREQSCWSAGYSVSALTATESPVTTQTPEYLEKLRPTIIEIDLSNSSQNLPGPHEWVRGVQPPDQNTGGWRRGWPSYCPVTANTAEAGPSPSLPGFTADPTRALGAAKPWLVPAGSTCLCPAQEVAKRHAGCSRLSGSAKTRCLEAWGKCGEPGSLDLACLQSWAQNDLPYQPDGGERLSADVTDCRVMDEDQDQKPGMTVSISALGASAVLRSASVVANVFWGKIDNSGAKKHWGVSQDQPALKSANVACENLSGIGASLFCGTSSGDLCPGYIPGQPADYDHRLNPLDFVSLHDKTPAGGGAWTCKAVYDNRAQLFPTPGWSNQAWVTKYPTARMCQQ